MGKTFFKVLVTIDEEFSFNPQVKQPFADEVYKELVSFVKSGCFIKSKISKFICENYYLGASQLVEKWNSALSSEDGKSYKTSNTFRSQISILSSHLYDLFCINADDLYSAFITCDVNTLKNISNIISSVELDDIDYLSTLVFNIEKYLGSLEFESDVPDLESCINEIKVLHCLEKSYIEEILSFLDKDKLRYIVGLMKKPLFVSSHSQVRNSKGNITKSVTKELNRGKASVLREMQSLPKPVISTKRYQGNGYSVEVENLFDLILKQCSDNPSLLQNEASEKELKSAEKLINFLNTDKTLDELLKATSYSALYKVISALKLK